MKDISDKRRDPVCNMWVDGGPYQRDYSGMHFIFCSAQCLERFNANPHLYIGHPGQLAPAQRGEVSMKKRYLVLTQLPAADIANRITHCLMEMMGVEDVSMTGRKLIIRYDLLQATLKQIENVIEGSGGRLNPSVWSRLRRGLIDLLEANELDARELPPPHGGHRH